MKDISIIIPACNEERIIQKTLEHYTNYVKKSFTNPEILVIVNGSSDKTSEIVKNFSQTEPIIIYKDYKEGIGKGGALMQGLKLAQGDLIGYVDADMAFPSEEFHKLVTFVNQGNDCACASRWIKGAKPLKKPPLKREIASKGFNFLIRTMFFMSIKDTQSGCKVFKKHIIKQALPHIGASRWAFDIDLLYNIHKRGFKIKEVPIIWNDDFDSKINLIKDPFEMFLTIIRLRIAHSKFKKLITLYESLPEKLRFKYYLK